jgi:hypothetical protein
MADCSRNDALSGIKEGKVIPVDLSKGGRKIRNPDADPELSFVRVTSGLIDRHDKAPGPQHASQALFVIA